jgi:hypothetical protein
MLATFVIGLREGLEAALIVGIVAAFLRQRGAKKAMRSVWIGVGAALAICLTVGIILQVVSQNLPQREQEGLETVIGAVAVVMVTYMVVWMRRHSRDLKGQLEGVAGTALARGSAGALIAMAFLAVLREGLETAVFLLAAFNASGNGLTAGLGALLGILVAVLLGYGIYRGGVRIDLSIADPIIDGVQTGLARYQQVKAGLAGVTLDQLRALDGGRLPIGLRAAGVTGPLPVTYSEQVSDRLWRDPVTGVLLDASRRTVVVATAHLPTGRFVIGNVRETVELPTAAARLAAVAVNDQQRTAAARAESWGSDYPALLGAAAAALALAALGAGIARRRETAGSGAAATAGSSPSPEPITSPITGTKVSAH